MHASDVPQQWEFYPCRVNDCPASISVNMWYPSQAPLADYPVMVFVFLKMPEPGEHGMGSGVTLEALAPVEDALVEHLVEAADAHHVGRVRSDGDWQIYFYAASREPFETLVDRLMEERHPDQPYFVDATDDAGWEHFHGFLAPSDRDMHWIMDRRVVDSLSERGDPLDVPRTIDHHAYFPDPPRRQAFAEAVFALGFEEQGRSDRDEPDDPLPCTLSFGREDVAVLAHIHGVVAELRALAAEHGGRYDGWGCLVQSTDADEGD